MTSSSQRDIREVLQGSFSSLTVRVAGMGAGYLPLFILSRYFGPVAVGVYALSISVFLALVIISTMGMPRVGVRFIAEAAAANHPQEITAVYKKVLTLVVPCAALVGLALYMAADLLAIQVFHEPAMARALRIVAFMLPCSALALTNASALRGLKRITESALFQVVVTPAVCAVVLVLFLYMLPRNTTRGIEAYGLAAACCALFSTLVWRHRRPPVEHPGKRPVTSFSRLLVVAWPMLVTSSTQTIMGNTDTIMLGMWCDISEVGIYRVAMRIAGLVTLPLLAVAAIAGPKFAEIDRDADPDRLKEVTRFTSRILVWSSIPLCALVLLSGRVLLGIFGEGFVAGYPALLTIALAQGINALCGVVGVFLEMTGYEKALRNAVIAGALCNVLLNLVLIPPLGITGAALASAASTVLWNVSASFLALRRFGFWVGFLPRWMSKS